MIETNAFHSQSRRLLRVTPFPLTALPSHPLLQTHQPASPSPPVLQSFILEVLNEAVAFSDFIVPSVFQKKGSPKSSAPSTAKVQMFSSDLLQGKDGKHEAWFARQSEHVNENVGGTATYEEFEHALWSEHSVHEKDYTPEVYDAYPVLDWREEIGGVQEEWGQFSNVAMEIYEMAHQLPFPLQPRVFATLIVRAFTSSPSSPSPKSFVVAQIPVDITTLPSALYSNGRNQAEGATAQKREKVTLGQYVSIERVKLLQGGKVWWEMATASDAKGNLPMSLQKMGVPGAIVKDVGFVIGWLEKQRTGTL